MSRLGLDPIPKVSILQLFQNSPYYNKTSKITNKQTENNKQTKQRHTSRSFDKGYLTWTCNHLPNGSHTTLQHMTWKTPGAIYTFVFHRDSKLNKSSRWYLWIHFLPSGVENQCAWLSLQRWNPNGHLAKRNPILAGRWCPSTSWHHCDRAGWELSGRAIGTALHSGVVSPRLSG